MQVKSVLYPNMVIHTAVGTVEFNNGVAEVTEEVYQALKNDEGLKRIGVLYEEQTDAEPKKEAPKKKPVTNK